MRIPVPPSPLPDEVVAVAQEYASGARTPVEPRDAATVVLMRDGGAGPEVYLLLRQTTMAFAAGMAVFPGGGVDARDFDADLGGARWAGPSAEEWGTRLGVEPDRARALVCAAVRETFEESGVLLAGATPDEVVADTTGEDWEVDREALVARDLAFTDFLGRRGLVLRSDLLGVWDAWVTPRFEPRRYRTWFFAAAVPQGQRTRDVSTESSSVTWKPATAVLDEVEAGRLAMMPPTYLNCLDVAGHADLSAALTSAAGRRAEMFEPRLEPLGEAWTLTMPERMRAPVAARRAARDASAARDDA
ncbi:NUDIX hydrolase [Nocardioides zeae]|uniref:NUDIX hydrolase n=1 Tax=Nocardioides imazamoxiresistens TaxID=3231893 RepID=A0ABU3Q006_9ACTN|nr:NUDIX hydrolase [Nocardioides zeae]MDT9594734.1 NUDIX hydrolase [Nocardioides zeae]